MAHGHDPRSLCPVFRLIGLCEILLEPAELIGNLRPSILDKEVVFSGEADEVNRSDVEAVEVVVD